MHKAYKFRIYPTKFQENLLNKTFGCVRFVWNKHVSSFNSFGVEGPVQQVTSKRLKDTDSFSFLNEVSASALQQKERDFEEFKKQYFSKSRAKKLGKPKFKKRGQNESYRLPNQKFVLDQTSKRIRLEKIGKVKIVLDRVIPDTVKFLNVTVSKTRTNEFYVSILVDEVIQTKPTTGRSVGIDLGFIDLVTMSNGLVIENPRWFRDNQFKLARNQKHLSRKVKGSNRYERQRLKVAKIHAKTARQRNWYHHQISSWLVNNFDTICMEDLNIASMKKLFGKSASDAGLSMLVNQIAYKSNFYGRTFHKVDRFFASSKTCSHCGEKTKFGLDVREWTCYNCDTKHDRDLNASINILKKGLQDLYDFTSAELTEVVVRNSNEYERVEDVRLKEVALHPLVATSMKRLTDFYEFV
jgi:putative transposase